MLEANPSEFPLFATLTPRFGEVFEHWAPKRRVSRDGQWPKAALVRLLGGARLLGLDDLMPLCFDDLEDVRGPPRRRSRRSARAYFWISSRRLRTASSPPTSSRRRSPCRPRT